MTCRLALRIGLVAAVAAPVAELHTQESPQDSAVIEGKALYAAGQFFEAIVAFEKSLRRLGGASDAGVYDADMKEAYLYLALSHLGLDRREAAKQAFKALLRLEPERRLDPGIHAPKVLSAFDDARAELAKDRQAGGEPSAGPKRKSSRSRKVLIGVGIAGAGTAALVKGVSDAAREQRGTTEEGCPFVQIEAGRLFIHDAPAWTAPQAGAMLSGRVTLQCAPVESLACVETVTYRLASGAGDRGSPIARASAPSFQAPWESGSVANGSYELVCSASGPFTTQTSQRSSETRIRVSVRN